MKKLLIGLLWLSLFGCTPDPERFAGHWQAVGLYQGGQSVAARLDSVRLSFPGRDRYVFQSAGFYKEAGPFRASGSYLFLTDTTLTPPKERTVKVLYLSDDTLKLLMKKGEAEQVLFLARK